MDTNFLASQYGFFSIVAIIIGILAVILVLSAKFKTVKIKGVEFGGTQEKKEYKIIRFDDWKKFSEELYDFCLKLLQPEEKHLYPIARIFESIISQSKKSYVERFLHFNHLPEYKSREYDEYICEHSRAIIKSVCNTIRIICLDYTSGIPPFDETKIAKSLSSLICKYRRKENKL